MMGKEADDEDEAEETAGGGKRRGRDNIDFAYDTSAFLSPSARFDP